MRGHHLQYIYKDVTPRKRSAPGASFLTMPTVVGHQDKSSDISLAAGGRQVLGFEVCIRIRHVAISLVVLSAVPLDLATARPG
jgi:hypothetical protein